MEFGAKSVTFYEMVKVFDLATAPPDLRESDDLAALRPGADEDQAAILTLKVGQYASPKLGPVNDCITREITLTEYRLHRWLTEQGAMQGENVLLRWKGGADW